MPIPSLIDLVEQDRQRNQETATGATKIVVSGIKNAKERSDQRDKAKNRANRGVRAPRYNATAELQDALWNAGAFKGMKNRQGKELTYAQAVDGVNGNMTKQAIKKAKSMGYTIDENRGKINKKRITVQDSKNNNSPNGLISAGQMAHAARTGGMSISLQNQKTNGNEVTVVNPVRMILDPSYSSNIPFFTALGDLTVGTANRIYRNVTGKGKDSYLIKNPDITDIPDDQKQILINFYKEKRDRTGTNPRAFTARDWKNIQGNYTGGNRNLITRAFLPSALSSLEHSLGQWNYYVDENGDVHAVDTYDWNDGETSANQGSYTTARDFMGEFGTKASETTAQRNKNGKSAARRMDINLGKI